MGVPDPCCGMNLQKATKILAIIEIILSTIVLILGIILFVGVLAIPKKEVEKEDYSYGVVLAATALFALVGLFGLIIAVILYFGSIHRDLVKCRIWFIIAVVLMVIDIAGLIGSIAGGRTNASGVSGTVLGLAIRGYCCWVVLAFMAELKGVNVPTS